MVNDVHEHQWTANSRKGDEIGFVCDTCKERYTREMTPEEKELCGKVEKVIGEDTHAVWWKFQKEVLNSGELGSELMDLVDNFAVEYPDWVSVVVVDDDHFASSYLVLIRHGTGDNYMGLTAVFIPQCTGDSPTVFFLYPGHSNSLIEALTAIHEVQKAIPLGHQGWVDKYLSKPSQFDVFNPGGLDKPWYKETGALEKKDEESDGLDTTL